MQMLGYHNHNFYCDGEGNLEEYLQEAVKQGFKAFGFSSHAPFNFYNKWSISLENLNKYTSEIEIFKKKYSEKLKVYRSLEIDYAPGKIEPFDFFREKYSLDYVIGSVHYVVHPRSGEMLFIDGPRDDFYGNLKKIFGGDIRYAVESYYEQTADMVKSQKPEIVGHIDKIIMNAGDLIMENDEYPLWYLQLIEGVLEEVAAAGSIVELNLRGLYKGRRNTVFIDERFIPLCNEKGIKFVISTDAHKPSEISLNYDYALNLLLKQGIEPVEIL
jgi:histidinol-phosphatase (PHP family)